MSENGKGMRRQAEGEQRVALNFLMTPEMKARLLEASFEAGESMALYLRKVIERYFDRHPVIPKEFDRSRVQRQSLPRGRDCVWGHTSLPPKLRTALQQKAYFERKSVSLLIHEILTEHFEREAIKKEIIS